MTFNLFWSGHQYNKILQQSWDWSWLILYGEKNWIYRNHQSYHSWLGKIVFLSVHLPLCPFVHAFICPFNICLFVWLYLCLLGHLSNCPPLLVCLLSVYSFVICLFVVSVCPNVGYFFYLFVDTSVCLIHLYVCLFVSSSIWLLYIFMFYILCFCFYLYTELNKFMLIFLTYSIGFLMLYPKIFYFSYK